MRSGSIEIREQSPAKWRLPLMRSYPQRLLLLSFDHPRGICALKRQTVYCPPARILGKHWRMLVPRLDVLPAAQRALWPELSATPRDFTLYGGTAIALRLGHRASADFDFFGRTDFDPDRLLATVPYLAGAQVLQREENTLTCRVTRGGPILVSFFGLPTIGYIEEPTPAEGPGVPVASLIDLAGMKASVVQKRAQAKDYIDIDALLAAGISPAGACRWQGHIRQGVRASNHAQGVDLLW